MFSDEDMHVDTRIKVEPTTEVEESHSNNTYSKAEDESPQNLNRNLETEAQFLESEYNNVMSGSYKVAEYPGPSMSDGEKS